MKKPTGGPGATGGTVGVDLLKEEAVRWPHLITYLSDSKWDDGAPRETSTLMLLVEDGCLKACLNDRAMQRSLWVAAGGLVAALDVLEGHLEEGSGEWRVKKPFGATGRKK